MSYPAWAMPFLDHLRESANIAASARAVGVSSSAAYGLRERDADFRASWDEALEDAFDMLEAEARRRAFQGVEEPVVYQGSMQWKTRQWIDEDGEEHWEYLRDAQGNRIPLTVTKYSDSLAQFLLKGYRRRKFGDKTEITGADGGALVIDDTARASRIAQLMALANTRKENEDLT